MVQLKLDYSSCQERIGKINITLCLVISQPLASHVHYSGSKLGGWGSRVPPLLKEFFNLPFPVLKARHLVLPMHLCLKSNNVFTLQLPTLTRKSYYPRREAGRVL